MNDFWKIELLTEEDGITFVDGRAITYKTGYQVATCGVECRSAAEAINACRSYNGNCGVWLSNGIYYVDKSYRIGSLKKALRIGKACHQISILKWHDMSLLYLKDRH